MHGDVTFVEDNPVMCPLLGNTFIMVQSPVRITKPSVHKQFAAEVIIFISTSLIGNVCTHPYGGAKW